ALWGGMFPVATGALAHIDPFTFTSLRITLVAAAFAAFARWKEGGGVFRLEGERIGLASFLGTTAFAGFGFLVFLGQKIAGPQEALTASITMGPHPMLGLLVTWVVRKAAPPRWSFLFIALSFLGVSLVVTQGDPAKLPHEPQSFAADGLILA